MTTPRKRFGQHFLRDKNIIEQIINLIQPKPGQHLVEIGPGQGALTLALLKKTGALDAIELDRDLIMPLQASCVDVGKLTLYAQDALRFDFNRLKQDQRLLRLVGNLPYNISTPLLFHLLTFTTIIDDMHFMLQKEVAARIAAPAGHDDYGRLSVMVQYACQVELLLEVPPDAFFPPPKVDSAVIRLAPYRQLPHPVKNFALFADVVRLSFGQRRKTLRNSLKKLVGAEDWQQIDIDPNQRAETLSVKDFVTICRAIEGKSSP